MFQSLKWTDNRPTGQTRFTLSREGYLGNIAGLLATDEIKQSWARHVRGIDTCDGDLARGIFAEDCELN